MGQIVITSWIFLLFALFLVILLTVFDMLKYKNKAYSRKVMIYNALFIYYICIIISFTLLPISYPSVVECSLEYNLDVRELFYAFINRAGLISCAENVILFMPLTILGYISSYKIMKTLKSVLICSCLFSISIEFIQGIECIANILEDFAPVIDINDVICNTLGGVLGFIVIRFYKKEHVAEI